MFILGNSHLLRVSGLCTGIVWGKCAIIIGETSVVIRIMGVVALTGNHIPEGRDKTLKRKMGCLEEVTTLHLRWHYRCDMMV
jgi:hypothetical protein